MIKRLRTFSWIVQAFVRRYKWVLLVAAVVGALTTTQLERLLTYLPQPKKTVHIARVGRYTLATLPRDIQTKLSQGLTQIGPTGLPQPAMADWQVIDGGLTYIFKIKPDNTWQDGTAVTAWDVNYSIEDVETEIKDDQTVIFRLNEPYAPFPTIVSQPLFKRQQQSYLQLFKLTRIYGTGDYQLKRIKYDGNFIDSLILESHKERLHFRFYPTERAAQLAFKLAEVDVVEGLSEADEFDDWPNVTVTETLTRDRYSVVYFNVEDQFLNEKKIRQALSYMIPKSEDTQVRALSPISPDSWAYNPNVKPYEYSAESARSLVEGLKTDFDLELTTTPNFVELAESIAASWEQLGLNVQIKIVNAPDIHNYQVLLIGQQTPTDPDQYLLWHSTQESNITNYDSVKVDKLLVDGRKELDEAKRREIYLNFQRFLLEDAPAAFIHYLETFSISRR